MSVSYFKNVAAVAAATFSLAILLMLIAIVSKVDAAEQPACGKVEVVYARGSGQPIDTSMERARFNTQINAMIKAPLTVTFYELGSQKQAGHQYPAVNVGDIRNGNAVGAWVSRGNANDYGASISEGVSEMIAYMTNRYVTCKAAGSKFVLAGYSQGAQVIGQYINAAPKEIRDHIAFVALFGDPKLHLPEGEGFNPPACRGEQLSAYRRVIANCDVDNGSLGARKPYLPVDMHGKTGLWCYANDFVCGSSKLAWDTEGHTKYGLEGNAVDSAAYEALQKVRATLPQEEQQYISTKRSSGDGTTGLDVMFVVDTTGSMGDKINQAKQFAAASAARIQALRGRVGLVSYRDAGDSYIARIESPLSNTMTDFTAKLQALTASGGGDTPEAALHALKIGMNGLSWQQGATKAAILLTDANYHDPDVVDGTTTAEVAKLALEIDPVNVYPVVPTYYANFYQRLAEPTNGQVILDTGDTEQALFTALSRLEQRPVALLKNQLYRAEPGQQITFDASDSYVEDAEITRYDWDFDGNGVYELHTTSPVATHTYTQLFDGSMQVRLTASNDTIASASAIVKVGTYAAPIRPAAPIGLVVTQDAGSSVVISWQAADNLASNWIISSDGIALGKVSAETATVTVGDLVRTDAINIEVSGMQADGAVGEYASVTIPPRQLSKPSSSPSRAIKTEDSSAITSTYLAAWYEPDYTAYTAVFSDSTADAPLHRSDSPFANLPTDMLGATVASPTSSLVSPLVFFAIAVLLMAVAAYTLKRLRR